MCVKILKYFEVREQCGDAKTLNFLCQGGRGLFCCHSNKHLSNTLIEHIFQLRTISQYQSIKLTKIPHLCLGALYDLLDPTPVPFRDSPHGLIQNWGGGGVPPHTKILLAVSECVGHQNSSSASLHFRICLCSGIGSLT